MIGLTPEMAAELRDLELGELLNTLIEDHAGWSQRTFGSDDERGPIGPLRHLAKEAKEAAEAEAVAMVDLTPGWSRSKLNEELADCLLLLLDASRRAGLKPLDLVREAEAKMKVNKTRVYKKPEWVFEEPQFVDDDCMGRKLEYWRVWARSGEKSVCGTGPTREAALAACRERTTWVPVEHVRDAAEVTAS